MTPSLTVEVLCHQVQVSDLNKIFQQRLHLGTLYLAGLIEPLYIFTPELRHDHDQQDYRQVHHAEHKLHTFRRGFQHVVTLVFPLSAAVCEE